MMEVQILNLNYSSMKRLFKLLTLTLVLLVSGFLHAQIAHKGEPYQWKTKAVSLADIPGIVTEKLDMAAIEAEDLVVDQYKETPYRFGIEREVSINVLAEGKFTQLPKGDKLWQYMITCPKATSINLLFSQWHVPVGGQVTIWSADRSEYLGVFNHENNMEWGSLAVGVIHTDKVVVEYYEQAQVTEQAVLEIGTIVHGYRSILNKWEVVEKGPFGNSGSCNMNVNCPDGAAWQNEKRGVALILNGGSAWCTGSLINNTAQDGTPYFLTAAHCNGVESNWVFYFNHETTGCTGSTGPTNQSISGATQLASGTASDYHLIRLSSNVPASYNPYFNGWDRSNSPVSTAVGIHHPSGDVKKISFDDDPLTKTNYSSNTVSASGTHWRIEAWERNTTTEGGSSGSPLFDQNKRIIGQLHGGAAACGNTLSDWYGAFGNSWSGLSALLDPLGTGALTLDGFGGSVTAPTCSDGIQNQGETGVDCGGPCAPCACNGNIVTVSITFDNYPEETSWTITSGTTVVASGGTYGSQPDGSTLNIPVCLPNGCYNFTITDSYGDGICCAYGNGSYTVSSSAGTLASGGSFTTSQTTQFCVGTTAATCSDGIQNQGETGVDCGGPCAACATCTDGIQNQGETGVDCGGPCAACATCSDGIQNQGETGVDCGGPNCAPCAGCTTVQINFNNIETSWGIWTDGGTDAARMSDAVNSFSGTRSLRIRDNTSTSVITTTSQNFTSYANLTVQFVFRGVGMETGEDFWLQISTNGGSTYTTVASYVFNSSLLNNTFYSATVPISGPFTSNTRIRFRCDASDDTDMVYLDDLRISGCQNAAMPLIDEAPAELKSAQLETPESVFSVYPNPANEVLNLSYQTELTERITISVIDMQGRVIRNEVLVAVPGANVFQVDTSSLIAGFYVIQVGSAELTHTKRFVVAR
jgi:hypothetical protein